MRKHCPAANAAIEQMLEDLKAEKAALLATLDGLHSDMKELAAAAAEAEELMFDETTWSKLTSFIEAVGMMQHLRKHARDKKAFAKTRELEKLVDAAVRNFFKSMQIEGGV